MVLYIALVALVMFGVFFVVKGLTTKRDKDINNFDYSFQNKSILKDIDFSDGNYALYIRHKKFGEFMVLDEQALIKNKDKLVVEKSFINYLPGEGDRNYGIMLFKNNNLVVSKTGGAFNTFKIGDLNDYYIPVKKKSFLGIKEEVQKQLDTIKNNKRTFLTHKSNFVDDNRAFSFRVYFPSMAVPVTRKKDGNGVKQLQTVNGIDYNTWVMKEEYTFEKKWSKYLKKCIRKKAGIISNFELNVYANSLSDIYLENNSNNLKSKEGRILYINDYMYYMFTAVINGNKSNSEKLLVLDYSDCLSEEDRNRPQLISKVKRLIKQSNDPNIDVDRGEVKLFEYKDEVSKDREVYHQEYQIDWLKIETKEQ